MSNDHSNLDSAPSPEQFAAFLDGELDSAARLRVEAWLTADPAAAAEIDGQRRIASLWEATPPPEPDAAAWTATLARIEKKVSPSRRRLPRTLWLGVGAAAAVLAAVVLSRFVFPGGAAIVDKTDPLANVGPGREIPAPAAQDQLLLASQDDVSIMNVEPFSQDDGQVPYIGEGEVPMIVAPRFARAGSREP